MTNPDRIRCSRALWGHVVATWPDPSAGPHSGVALHGPHVTRPPGRQRKIVPLRGDTPDHQREAVCVSDAPDFAADGARSCLWSGAAGFRHIGCSREPVRRPSGLDRWRRQADHA